MKRTKAWAKAVIVADRIQDGFRKNPPFADPRLLVQETTENVILYGAPTESFSEKMPVYFPPEPTERELYPIDVLYGQYDPKSSKITIFEKRITQDAIQVFNCEPADLIAVVRIHEYAHALVHLGINAREIEKQLSDRNSEGETDWEKFRLERDSAFTSLDSDIHELLAQSITWSTLVALKNSSESERLRNTFTALEAKQPVPYKLPPSVKKKARNTNWVTVLQTARGLIDPHKESGFAAIEGMIELMLASRKLRRK